MALGKAGASLKTTDISNEQPAKALRNDVRLAETKLRDFLMAHGCGTLPKRVLPEPDVDNADKKQSAPSGTDLAPVMMAAPISIKNGSVQETVATRAYDAGFAAGKEVVLLAGKKRDAIGTVVSVSRDNLVVDWAHGQETYKLRDLDKVALKGTPAAEKKGAKAALESDQRQPGVPWQKIADRDAEAAVLQWLSLAMFHIHLSSSPDPSVIRVHAETNGSVISLDVEAKEHALVFVPFARAYERLDSLPPAAKRARNGAAAAAATHAKVLIKFAMKKDTECNYVHAIGADSDTIFWKLLSDASHHVAGPATLVWKTATMDVPFKANYVDRAKSNLTKSSGQRTLSVTFPYLTNTEVLPPRAALTIPASGPPDIL